MKSSHRFPLRRQIVWGMRFFTFLTSLAVGAALFILSNQYMRANSLQAAEFNLRLVATSIETRGLHREWYRIRQPEPS